MKPALALTLLLATLLLAAGCGSSTTTVTKTVTVTKATRAGGGTGGSAAAAAASTTTTTPAAPKAPTSATSGGITIKLLDVSQAKNLHYIGGTIDDATPKGEPVTVKAPQGGHYVFVKTRVSNRAKQALSLTCGQPIIAQLLDQEGATYDPVNSLSLLKGNPGCGDSLQPGFKDQMTWAYLVPPGSKADTFQFADASDSGSAPETSAYITLPAS